MFLHKTLHRRNVMRSRYLIASGLCAAVFAAGVLAPAQAKTMKECAAEWDTMKAAKQTGGMKYRDFSKQCMSGGAAAPTAIAPTAPAAPASGPATAAPTTTAKPATGATGRQAMIARERACGAEW